MRNLELTAEDMADLIAGHSINAMLEDGEEIRVVAPGGVNEAWNRDGETDEGILSERKARYERGQTGWV